MHKSPSVSSFRILNTMLVIYRQVKKQERYLKSYLPNLLAGVVPDYQQTFSDKDIKRITKYWQLALNLVCNNVYKLVGAALSEEEYKRITLLSVFGPLFDDLFDDHIPAKYACLNNNYSINLLIKPSAGNQQILVCLKRAK